MRKFEALGRKVWIPNGVSQFAIIKEGADWLVVRADTLVPCPPVAIPPWPGRHRELRFAEAEACERQAMWTSLAIDMLGQAVAGEMGTSSPTRFEIDAYQTRRLPPHRRELR